MEPGEYFLRDEPIDLNPGRRSIKLKVSNTGDRTIHLGSHYHFFEVNKALDFDRAAAMGMRLNIIAGSTSRFEPGDTREVELVEFGGWRRAVGFSGLVEGSTTSGATQAMAMERARLFGYKGADAEAPSKKGGRS